MRSCGPCTACCTLTFVPELDKQEGVTCEHCDKGCRIYEGRPASCSAYQCEWLKGALPEFMRPDVCGVMVEDYPLMTAAMLTPGAKLYDLSPVTLSVLDGYLNKGKPVIATGQFARLPAGMDAVEAKRRMMQTIREYRGA
jgi:Fe-S-cluster containining protein